MQKDNKTNWMINPTKKQAALTFLAWLAAITCSIIAGTKLFTLSPFKIISISFISAHLVVTVIMLVVCINYFRNKHKVTI